MAGDHNNMKNTTIRSSYLRVNDRDVPILFDTEFVYISLKDIRKKDIVIKEEEVSDGTERSDSR